MLWGELQGKSWMDVVVEGISCLNVPTLHIDSLLPPMGFCLGRITFKQHYHLLQCVCWRILDDDHQPLKISPGHFFRTRYNKRQSKGENRVIVQTVLTKKLHTVFTGSRYLASRNTSTKRGRSPTCCLTCWTCIIGELWYRSY